MKKLKLRNDPEAQIQRDIIEFLTNRGWFVKVTHGNMYQSGFPDLYCCHKMYGTRWIEVKNPKAYQFTKAQLDNFPKFVMNGAGVWILIAATEEEYQKLFKPCNWWQYLSILK